MNRPLRPQDPASIPYRRPRISAQGHKQWDPATFLIYVLPRWATLGGGREPLPMRKP